MMTCNMILYFAAKVLVIFYSAKFYIIFMTELSINKFELL